ncbi:MAG: hypothetical protein LBG80_16020 [Bacteroidales bacterium]|jgi:hypothetical protein|nr:hypothetical protein [Bacteroidales bacterium]
MKLRCGHDTNCNLDTICPKCGKNFFPAYIPFLFIVVILLAFYYLRPFSFKDLFTPLFWIFSWFLLTIILRHRTRELFNALMLTIPTMLICAITNYNLPDYLTEIREILLVISTIMITIPILSSIGLGFQDAVHLNRLNKGSYLIVITIIISIFITFLHLIFPTIILICKNQRLESATLQSVYDYFELIYRYRRIFVAFVLGLVSVISISISLIRELKVKSYNIPDTPNNIQSNSFIVSIIYTNMGNITKMVTQGIKIVSNLIYQILTIIFDEVFKLIKDTIYRAVLILFRFMRVIFIIVLTFFLSEITNKISYRMEGLWLSGDFWTMDISHWALFLLLCFISCFLLLIISILTYRKWKKITDLSIGFKRIFLFVLYSKDDTLACRSVTVSTLMYVFYFLLSFFGAWLIINLIHYMLKLDYANPIGFLFVFSFVFSVGLIVINKILKKITLNAMKRFFTVLILLNSSILFAQKKGNDDEWLNPRADPQHTTQKAPYNPYGKPLKEDMHELKNYEKGNHLHENMVLFSNNIISIIDKIEQKENKIISIDITGFADGIPNSGIPYNPQKKYPRCSFNIDAKTIINDYRLAILRACQIEELLKIGLEFKIYFMQVQFSKNAIDAPDGVNIGGEHRKVTVKISYIIKK